MICVDGDIRRSNVPPMDHAQVQGLIYDIMNDQQRRIHEDQWRLDR
jgi:twitching motility protein PilT